MFKPFICVTLLFCATAVAANSPQKFMTTEQKVGDARMSVMFWDVYDASLYAPRGEWSFDAPFALELKYLMEFSGKEIAERSIEEIRGLGFDDEMKLAAWYSHMCHIFPDVAEGAEIVGYYQPNKATEFFYGGKSIGTIHDPEFGRWFFGIWLAEKTSDKSFRAKLLGQK